LTPNRPHKVRSSGTALGDLGAVRRAVASRFGWDGRVIGNTSRTCFANISQKAVLVALGVDPMEMTSTEFDAHVEKQIALDAALVKKAGIKTH
jgi:hypothetical protein